MGNMGFRIGDQVVVARQHEAKLAQLRQSVEEARRQTFNAFPLTAMIEAYISALGKTFQIVKIKSAEYGVQASDDRIIYFPAECLERP